MIQTIYAFIGGLTLLLIALVLLLGAFAWSLDSFRRRKDKKACSIALAEIETEMENTRDWCHLSPTVHEVCQRFLGFVADVRQNPTGNNLCKETIETFRDKVNSHQDSLVEMASEQVKLRKALFEMCSFAEYLGKEVLPSLGDGNHDGDYIWQNRELLGLSEHEIATKNFHGLDKN